MKPAMRLASTDRPTTVRHLMTMAPHTIGAEQKLKAAHEMMRQYGLRHLPVLRGGHLVGILSQRDLFFLETISGVDVDIDQVVDAMSPEVYTVEPEASVRDVARVMAKQKYGAAVVLDGGHVVGIFTATDALLHLANALPELE